MTALADNGGSLPCEPIAGTPIAEALRSVVLSRPDAVAVNSARRDYTYAEIDRWSDAIAAALIAAGAPPERPVAIITSDNVLLIPTAVAAVKAGHYYITIDAADPEERIAMLLREAQVGAAITDDRERLRGTVGPLPVIDIGGVPAESVPLPARPPNALVNVIFTSGTTGRPKGIATAQKGFVEAAAAKARREGALPGSRVMFRTLPGFARANGIIGPLLAGSTLCAFDARNESLSAIAGFIAREKLAHINLTPAMLRRLLRESPPELDLSSVKKLRCGADIVTVADIEAFRQHFPRGCTWEYGYASSETGGGVFHISIDHDTPIPGPLVPMGKPSQGVEVWLRDDEGNDVPDGVPGELYVRSSSVAAGYWNDPELSAERFAVDPENPGLRTFRTGDLVMRDAEGIYYFIGRKDFRLRIHNRRIDPLEVETALIGTCGVREAVAVAHPDAYGEMHLVAYVVMESGSECDVRAIRHALRTKVAAWMIPSRIHAIEKMPTSKASGKVDRRELAARVEPPVVLEDTGASDPIETRLATIWARVLGTAVHLDDDYFDDLGGESVAAAHLVTAVEKELGRTIPLSLIVELNTVRKMAEYLRTPRPEQPLAVLIQQGTDPSLEPVFITAGGGGAVVKYRPLAREMGSRYTVYGIQPHGFSLATFPKTWEALIQAYAHAIRELQPHGPYYLAGYSAGGNTALGIAATMERRGEPVAFVGAIDTAARSRLIPFWRRVLNRIMMIIEQPKRIRRLPRELRKKLRKKGRRRLQNRYLEEGEDLPPFLAQTRRELQRASRKTSGAGVEYGGAVTLFRARDGVVRARIEKDLGWSRVARGPLHIIDVDGDHGTVLSEHVESLAAAMAAAIEQARTVYSARP